MHEDSTPGYLTSVGAMRRLAAGALRAEAMLSSRQPSRLELEQAVELTRQCIGHAQLACALARQELRLSTAHPATAAPEGVDPVGPWPSSRGARHSAAHTFTGGTSA